VFFQIVLCDSATETSTTTTTMASSTTRGRKRPPIIILWTTTESFNATTTANNETDNTSTPHYPRFPTTGVIIIFGLSPRDSTILVAVGVVVITFSLMICFRRLIIRYRRRRGSATYRSHVNSSTPDGSDEELEIGLSRPAILNRDSLLTSDESSSPSPPQSSQKQKVEDFEMTDLFAVVERKKKKN